MLQTSNHIVLSGRLIVGAATEAARATTVMTPRFSIAAQANGLVVNVQAVRPPPALAR